MVPRDHKGIPNMNGSLNGCGDVDVSLLLLLSLFLRQLLWIYNCKSNSSGIVTDLIIIGSVVYPDPFNTDAACKGSRKNIVYRSSILK